MENKENIWISRDVWKIVPEGGGKVRIEQMSEEKSEISEEKSDNVSSTESYNDKPNDKKGGTFKEIVYKAIAFLLNPYGCGSRVKIQNSDGGKKVIGKVCKEDVKNDRQLWKKGQPTEDGYFTLEVETPKGPKFLTADSKDGLQIKGNFG